MKRYIKAKTELSEQLNDLLDALDDDFGYVVQGIERLGRLGNNQGAMQAATELSQALNNIIAELANLESR